MSQPKQPLYTPVYNLANHGKRVEGEDLLVKTLRKIFKEAGRQELVPFIRAGVRVFNYIYDAQRAAEETLPKGFVLEPLVVTASTAKATGAARVANVISELLSAALKIPLFELYSTPMISLSEIKKRRFSGPCCENGTFGKKHGCQKQPGRPTLAWSRRCRP